MLLAALFVPLGTCRACGTTQELRASDHWQLLAGFILPSVLLLLRMIRPKLATTLSIFELIGVILTGYCLVAATLFYKAEIGLDLATDGLELVVAADIIDITTKLVERYRARTVIP